MTYNEYKRMADALSCIMHKYGVDSQEQFNAVFDGSVCCIADILERNSTKFNRMRFYTDIYGVDLAAELLQKERESTQHTNNEIIGA